MQVDAVRTHAVSVVVLGHRLRQARPDVGLVVLVAGLLGQQVVQVQVLPVEVLLLRVRARQRAMAIRLGRLARVIE